MNIFKINVEQTLFRSSLTDEDLPISAPTTARFSLSRVKELYYDYNSDRVLAL